MFFHLVALAGPLAACHCSSGSGSAPVCVEPAGTCTPPGSATLVAGGMAGPSSAPASCVLVPPAVSSGLPDGGVLHLGTRTVGEVVTFDVAAGTGSVSIVSQGTNAAMPRTIDYQGSAIDNTVVPLTVTAGGRQLYDDNVLPPADPAADGGVDVYYAGASPWAGTMTIPNTSRMLCGGVPGGSWSAVVNDWAAECSAIGAPTCLVGDGGAYPASTYDVTVITKPGPIASTGTIDVAFYLVTSLPITSATAVTDPDLQRVVSTLRTLFAKAGLCLGSVTFYDVPAWAKARYATGVNADTSDPCGTLSQMLTLAIPAQAMNFFLVDDIQSASTGGGTVVGVDGTIPGPSSFGGTIASGVAVSAAYLGKTMSLGACNGGVSLACGDDVIAFIAAHEAGHFLGLYHTTEAVGAYFDPVADTPTCPCPVCKPAASTATCQTAFGPPPASPYLVDGQDCTASAKCSGGDNLMFWQLSSHSQGLVSPEQGAIVRANPLVR